MRDISKWFESKSTEQDSAGIRKHLDNLIGRLMNAPHGRPAEVETVPDPEHPDEPVNSL